MCERDRERARERETPRHVNMSWLPLEVSAREEFSFHSSLGTLRPPPAAVVRCS